VDKSQEVIRKTKEARKMEEAENGDEEKELKKNK
jgi:hypothetical protein